MDNNKIFLLKLMVLGTGAYILLFILLQMQISQSHSDSCCQQSLIKVRGHSELKKISDLVILDIHFEILEKTELLAFQKLTTSVKKLIAIMKQKGFDDKNYQTYRLEVKNEYDQLYGHFKIIGKRAYQIMTITIPNPDSKGAKIGAFIDEIVKIPGFNIDLISYDFSNKSKLEAQARETALLNAKQKALDFCQAANLKLGEVYQINEAPSNQRNRATNLPQSSNMRAEEGQYKKPFAQLLSNGEFRMTYSMLVTFQFSSII